MLAGRGRMQAGLFAIRRSVGRIRRFWAGFEATGLGLLLAYIACSYAGLRVFDRWAYKVSESVYGSLRGLPPDAFRWCFEHGLVIDPRKPLKVYEVVAVFEVAYGLPMLILAIVGGFLAAKLGSQRALRPLATSLSASDDPKLARTDGRGTMREHGTGDLEMRPARNPDGL